MPCHVRLRWPKQLSNVLSDCSQKLNGLENLKFFGWPKKVLGSIDIVPGRCSHSSCFCWCMAGSMTGRIFSSSRLSGGCSCRCCRAPGRPRQSRQNAFASPNPYRPLKSRPKLQRKNYFLGILIR